MDKKKMVQVLSFVLVAAVVVGLVASVIPLLV